VLLLLTACAAPVAGPALPESDTAPALVRLGTAADAQPVLHGPSLLLQGSGRPLAPAFAAHAARVASGPVDVVVLSASAASGSSRTPECDVVVSLPAINSCTTVTILAPGGAEDERVERAVDHAEIVYFAGGDQCRYVRWHGTRLHAAVQRVHARGGGVGGGSAGLAIQGEFVYDACEGSATSARALSNPFHPEISFTRGFLTWPALRRVMTDSHFVERDRMGRLLAYLARQLAEHPGATVLGLGIDGGAALVLDTSGTGEVFGGTVHVVHAAGLPERLAPGNPLTHRDFIVQRLEPGARYSLAERPAAGGYPRSVVDGVIDGPPYSP
jgi:cyanophycinase-like exopeptidase